MKKIITSLILILTIMSTQGQANDHAVIAEKAFAAWQEGEKTGNYTNFKVFLQSDFKEFSHPLLGSYTGEAARIKFLELIAQREITKNQLDFTDVKVISNENHFVFAFNSSGSVAGGYKYQGFNAVLLTVEKHKLTGFREYFGLIDPSWFK